MWIETTMHMSGTRASGDRWPPAFTAFEVEDWEGEHMIKGGMARLADPPAAPAPAPEPEPVPVPEPPMPRRVQTEPDLVAPAPEPVKSAVATRTATPPEPEPAPEPFTPLVPSAGPPPAPSDPKQAWVDYAVTQGMSGDDASRMTKADLQSRFGPRL